MTNGLERFLGEQRELERALQRMRPILEAVDRIPESLLDGLGKLDHFHNQLTLPADYLASASRIRQELAQWPIIETLGLLNKIGSPAARELRRQHTQLADLAARLRTPAHEIQASLRPMLDSLASTEALLRLERLNEGWLALALQPHLAFQEFAKKHLSLAATASDLARHNRLSLLDSSGRLLESVARGFDLAAIMRPPKVELWTGPIPDVNVYRTLDGEVESLNLEETEIDTDLAVRESWSGMIAELGARMVDCVYKINTESERLGESQVFKTTTRVCKSCAIIPARVAIDENSFTEVIDHLFFLIYEGSGDGKRLTARCDKSKLGALWRLKHLRLDARHDLDHGSEPDAKRKKVAEAYLSLVGQVVPRTKEDWMSAQRKLYADLCKMLEEIWSGEEAKRAGPSRTKRND